MALEHIDTVEISEAYLPALINGDYTGLEDDEVPLVEAYDQKMAGCVLDVVFDGGDFKRCAVSGLLSDTYTVKVWRY